MRVWMVHEEDGQYSDWRFNVVGVFSSRERAVEFVMSQRAPVDEDGYRLHSWDPEPAAGYALPKEVGDHWMLCEEDWFVTEYEVDAPLQVDRTYDYLSLS